MFSKLLVCLLQASPANINSHITTIHGVKVRDHAMGEYKVKGHQNKGIQSFG